MTAAHVAMGRLLTVLLRTPPTDPLGPVAQDPDASRDAVCHIVATSSQCAAPQTTTVDLHPASSTSSGGGASIAGVLLWLLLAAALVAAAIVVVRLRRDRVRVSADDDAALDDVLGTVVIDHSREPGGWRAEADAHREAGRFRDALRCRYRALVGDLARRGLLDEIPGRTTGEERRELARTAPDAVDAFRTAADLFDDAWYGSLDVAAEDDDRFQILERDVLQRAPTLLDRIPGRLAAGERRPEVPV